MEVSVNESFNGFEDWCLQYDNRLWADSDAVVAPKIWNGWPSTVAC